MTSTMDQIRADRERREQVLLDAGFEGIHVSGDLFGHEFTVCTRCGALVSLGVKVADDGTRYAWAMQQHLDWHEAQP